MREKQNYNTGMISRPPAQGLYSPKFETANCGTGFIAQIKQKESRAIVTDALQILNRMKHRGGRGAEKNTGDGVGIMVSMPHQFFSRMSQDKSMGFPFSLPRRGLYAAGIVFFPQDKTHRNICQRIFEDSLATYNLKLLAWRTVPTDNSDLGDRARECEPVIKQCFVTSKNNDAKFEQKLYLATKYNSNHIRNSACDPHSMFYICSLSSKTITYKGMLTNAQLEKYYLDLQQDDFTAYLGLVHSRFSTNTFPSWDRAQPLRMISHNGEINTLYGNIAKMHSREGLMQSDVFKKQLSHLYPVIEHDVSDSGAFDNSLEFLYKNGYSLPQAVCMMIPEAWQHNNVISPSRKAMYQAYSCLMEPWDGPACITFSDGRYIGAVIDRNGLRPSRYYITNDDRVILASEFGVIDIDPTKIVEKNRLRPGRVFFIDTQEGCIISDEKIKKNLASMQDYKTWVKNEQIKLTDLQYKDVHKAKKKILDKKTLQNKSLAYGYDEEDKHFILKPMVELTKEPLGSMGNDVALACLTEKPRLLYDYFKQWFSQVTNPPIDSIRERLIMSLLSYIGPEGNLLQLKSQDCHKLCLETPLVGHSEFAMLQNIQSSNLHSNWESHTIDITYNKNAGVQGLGNALIRIKKEANLAAKKGVQIIILSDRNMGENRLPISAIMAAGAVHHHLVDTRLRSKSALIVESGEIREIHHYCMLISYGADAFFPYLALENAFDLRDKRIIDKSYTNKKILKSYKKAVDYGLCKVFAKMGISTIDSYKGSQIFEAVGIGQEVIDVCFKNTVSRIGGIGFEAIHKETLIRHTRAYKDVKNTLIGDKIINAGNLQWRKNGLPHMWDPESIALLQHAVRQNDKDTFSKFIHHQNSHVTKKTTIRGQLTFQKNSTRSIPLSEVEPVESLLKRFVTGGMSFGSISQEAHETLALAMNKIGGKSNTGEGGELPQRYKPLANGDSKRSAIKQVASGRFGVTIEYLSNADEIQIKMAQGAKPGEGGELPGHKVSKLIAKTRYSTPGIGLISPPPHHDIYSIEDLAELIYDLKSANPLARISVKLVSKSGVGVIAAGVVKAKADHILISGYDGGTGASPITSIKHAGLPWELGLAETHQILVKNNLRSRVILQTDGQIKTGKDIVIATMLGAEEFGFATSALIAMGCVMMRKCEHNTCPVGIATQDTQLRKKFMGKPEHVIRFMRFLAEDLQQEMAALGFKSLEAMVGRSDLLRCDTTMNNWKSKHLNFNSLLGLHVSDKNKHKKLYNQYCNSSQDHKLYTTINKQLIKDTAESLRSGKKITLHYKLKNTDRATGTILSNKIALQYGLKGLSNDTISVNFDGHAGQSFGAFLAHGLTLNLSGDANDYVGKGLSGGIICISPPKERSFTAEDNIIVGNVVLYGAIRGKAFFRGRAAERFCIRNSGAKVVVEGVGAHGCEYMTGGRVVILGDVGRNFASGMSGGIVYVWDINNTVKTNRSPSLLVEAIDGIYETELVNFIKEHYKRTASLRAKNILSRWKIEKNNFLKIISKEYKNILDIQTTLKTKHKEFT